MRFSFNWLSEWLDLESSADEVAKRLTSAGLEADSVTPVGVGLDGVVVGEIVDCKPHPDADRLQICTVKAGDDEALQIVCGAPNARTGLKAPLARIGAALPGGLKIKPAKLRGIESNGMLCSAPELGLGDDAAGLLELPEQSSAGTPLACLLGLPDWVIELDLTPNRSDCLSLRGIAHELAALEGCALRVPDMPPVPAQIDDTLAIELKAPADCPRYAGRVIRGINPTAATPAWMVERLTRSGVRSLGPVVDVTNYVLLELGQPMHAFDLERIEGPIQVRRAAENESLVLLDESDIKAESDMLLIADQTKPLALAGIMGGADSAVSDETRDILLESAWFNPASISGRARRLGMATDSSHRFERGVDPELQRLAIERATALIIEIAGGRPGPVLDESDPQHMPATHDVDLRPARVNQLLGTDLASNRIADLLSGLGMQVAADGERLSVRPPSRRRDIELEVDLIEEVARLVGYDALPSKRPGGSLRSQVPSEKQVPERAIRDGLQARGFQEIMSWSFVSSADLGRFQMTDSAQPLANPLNVDMSVLRTSLLPGLVRTARTNLRHQRSRLRLYELGHVFSQDTSQGEQLRLALLLTGQRHRESWSQPSLTVDFYDVKGEVEQLLATAGHASTELELSDAQVPYLHPGQSAQIKLKGQSIGWIGQLHPTLLDELDISQSVFVAEMDWRRISDRQLPSYRAVGRFPAVRRDLALIAPESLSAANIQKTIESAAGALLEQCIIFDIYAGKGIESGFKSIAIGLIFREVSRTLTDEEIERVVSSVVTRLQQDCNVTLRGTN